MLRICHAEFKWPMIKLISSYWIARTRFGVKQYNSKIKNRFGET